MPWKLFGNCVHKENAEGGKGDLVPGGCHKTHAEAVAHMRALYASEAKDITDATLNLLKEIASDSEENKPERASAVLDEWKTRVMLIPDEEIIEEKAVEQVEEIIPDEADEKAKRSDVSAADRARAEEEYGDVEYADETNKKYPLSTESHIRSAWSYINMPRNSAKYPDKGAAIKRKIIAAWKKKIDPKGPPAAKKDLLDKLQEIGEAIKSWFKNEPEDETGISIWKEGNQYWWMARYSNKFRDNDNPPEIISSESHKRFVSLVKEGKAPLPVLQPWHKKEWTCGKAHGVSYDELGFAVALGTFNAGAEDVAEALMNSKESIKLSHGKPLINNKK
jgi:hypothetical protein